VSQRNGPTTVPRRILHVDMNAFFVACELTRRPELRGRPVVVGSASRRGVVAAASYEARRFGITSAMPSVRAERLCPDTVFLDADHSFYAEVSEKVFAVFADFTPLVEGVSVDEAFLDVTGAQRLLGSPRAIAGDIRRRIHDEIELGCSVGIAANKFVAKMASEVAKPRASRTAIDPGPGIVEVPDGGEREFLAPLDVGALWGVGPSTAERLRELGVATIGDLAALDVRIVEHALGASLGRAVHELSHGIDDRPVVADREAKSIGSEETFASDVHDRGDLRNRLRDMADDVARRCRATDVGARTLTLKIRYSDFDTVSRARTVPTAMTTVQEFMLVVDQLLVELFGETQPGVRLERGIRLAGVSARNLVVPETAAQLFVDDATQRTEQWRQAAGAVDHIRDRFGPDAIS
jgi:DNA polymerase-4